MDSRRDSHKKRKRYDSDDERSHKHTKRRKSDQYEELRVQREERSKYDKQRIERRQKERSSSPGWGQGNTDGSHTRDIKPPIIKQEKSSPIKEEKSIKKEKKEAAEKEKPNFETSGKLTEDTNTFRGVVVKYNQPPEARKPKRRWRLYIFKGQTSLPFLPLHRQSAYLLGRDRRVADIPIDHPSCSKQHAVFQYRLVSFQRPDGKQGKRILPYLIDLNSANGTYINHKKIEPQRYVELLEMDVIRFGFSSREYVLMLETSGENEIPQEDNE